MRALLKNRSFRRLWAGQLVSSFGDALTSLVLLLTAQRLTGSTAAVAATAIAIALPQLLIGLPAGVLVDRWDRRRLMVSSDLARAVLVLGFLAVTTADRLWLLYALAFAQSAVGTLFNPARAALLADVVPGAQLLSANSLSDTTRVIASVAGVATAGILASSSSSLSIVFILDALTFLASALLIAGVGTVAIVGSERRHARSELADGLRLIVHSRILLGVSLAGATVMLGVAAVNVLLVPFLVEDLAASEAWFGALEGAQVAAMVAAGALLTLLAPRARPRRLIATAATGLGACVAAIALCSSPWQLLPLFFAAGWFIPPIQASVTTILQTSVPPALRGRTHATVSTLISAASLGSIALAGATAGALGLRTVFLLSGLIVVSAGFTALVALRPPERSSVTALETC